MGVVMMKFITRSIQTLKNMFTAVGSFFTWLTGLFRKKERVHTYSFSSDDVPHRVNNLKDSDPRYYISEMVHCLNYGNAKDTAFQNDLPRFTTVVLKSEAINPTYDLRTAEGRTTLVDDTITKYGLTNSQIMPTLGFLSQFLPQSLIMVLHGLHPNRQFIPTDGTSELKVNAGRISLKYDFEAYVTSSTEVTAEDIQSRNAGKSQIKISTIATIDLKKLHVVNDKIERDSNAITHSTTIKINNKLDLDLSAIEEKLHEKIEPDTTQAVTPLVHTLTRKKVLTRNLSKVDKIINQGSFKLIAAQTPATTKVKCY